LRKDISSLPYLDKEDPWSSHSIIVQWLKELPEKNTILDIGTASGTLGRLCAGSGLIRKGIEPNCTWATLAKPYYEELLNCTINDAEDEFLQGANAVVLADVLEHLADPENTLMRLIYLQQPDCQFMISVPNIANIWIRLNLLIGRFDYTERGILDKSHLRFFTRKSFDDLLKKCDLNIMEIKSTPIPLNLIHNFFSDNPIGRSIHYLLSITTRLLPSLLGYQFVVLTKKSMKRK